MTPSALAHLDQVDQTALAVSVVVQVNALADNHIGESARDKAHLATRDDDPNPGITSDLPLNAICLSGIAANDQFGSFGLIGHGSPI